MIGTYRSRADIVRCADGSRSPLGGAVGGTLIHTQVLLLTAYTFELDNDVSIVLHLS